MAVYSKVMYSERINIEKVSLMDLVDRCRVDFELTFNRDSSKLDRRLLIKSIDEGFDSVDTQ